MGYCSPEPAKGYSLRPGKLTGKEAETWSNQATCLVSEVRFQYLGAERGDPK